MLVRDDSIAKCRLVLSIKQQKFTVAAGLKFLAPFYMLSTMDISFRTFFSLAFLQLVHSATGSIVIKNSENATFSFADADAAFGGIIPPNGMVGVLQLADPVDGCSPLQNTLAQRSASFALIRRGGCTFDVKVRSAQAAGFRAVVVFNNEVGRDLITMAGRDIEGLYIPAVFVTSNAGEGGGGTSETCAICLEDYEDGDKLRVLPCRHEFHVPCVDHWLTTRSPFCPICKRDASEPGGVARASERTPLLGSQDAGPSPGGSAGAGGPTDSSPGPDTGGTNSTATEGSSGGPACRLSAADGLPTTVTPVPPSAAARGPALPSPGPAEFTAVDVPPALTGEGEGETGASEC